MPPPLSDPTDPNLDPKPTEPDADGDRGADMDGSEPIDTPVPLVDPNAGWTLLSGDQSLSEGEANRVAGHHGGTVILVAGCLDAGKTTMLVQLFDQFLRGPFAGLTFAGSETLDAFDARHFGCRYDSGNPKPDTDRTPDIDMRFLHLRLAEDGQRRALLPTDLRGELFEDLVNGAKVADRIPIAATAAKTVLLVDGATLADLRSRETAETNALLLIGSLASAGGLRHGSPLLIVLSKADLLDHDKALLGWAKACLSRLEDEAKRRGFTNVDHLVLAARPEAGGSPQGLKRLLKWMWEPSSELPVRTPAVLPAGRTYLTGRLGDQ